MATPSRDRPSFRRPHSPHARRRPTTPTPRRHQARSGFHTYVLLIRCGRQRPDEAISLCGVRSHAASRGRPRTMRMTCTAVDRSLRTRAASPCITPATRSGPTAKSCRRGETCRMHALGRANPTSRTRPQSRAGHAHWRSWTHRDRSPTGSPRGSSWGSDQSSAPKDSTSRNRTIGRVTDRTKTTTPRKSRGVGNLRLKPD